MAHAVQVFSTNGIPVLRKAATWNLMLGELDVQALPRDPMHFDGTLIRQRVGPLTLFEVRCGSLRLRHGRARGTRGGRPSFQLLMPVQGEFTLTHGDRAASTVGTGSFCLIDRTEPYELIHGDGQRTIGLELPHSLLETCLPSAAGYAGAVVRPDSGAGRLLAGLLHGLSDELNSEDAAGTLPSMVARSIAGFVAAAFVDRSRVPVQRGSRARLAAFRDFVETHLADGDFRPLDVARQFNVSERYVRLVFQEAGETLSSYLLRKRLERAAQLLRNEHNGSHTITEIALECGFNSASHFGHSFRQRFGKTPREFRAGGRLRRHPG
jgi:AraC-like DNA-binding protein